jgi:hypothetical protein
MFVFVTLLSLCEWDDNRLRYNQTTKGSSWVKFNGYFAYVGRHRLKSPAHQIPLDSFRKMAYEVEDEPEGGDGDSKLEEVECLLANLIAQVKRVFHICDLANASLTCSDAFSLSLGPSPWVYSSPSQDVGPLQSRRFPSPDCDKRILAICFAFSTKLRLFVCTQFSCRCMGKWVDLWQELLTD